MKKIKLTQGKYTIVDNEDFKFLNQWKWTLSSTSHVVRQIMKNYKGTRILMHRVLLNPPINMVVDHINGNGLDNRRINLRICTRTQNLQNQKRNSKNKTGYKGVFVSVDKRIGKKYINAKIQVNKKQIWLGYFPSFLTAYEAYCKAAKKYHGKFARLK